VFFNYLKMLSVAIFIYTQRDNDNVMKSKSAETRISNIQYILKHKVYFGESQKRVALTYLNYRPRNN